MPVETAQADTLVAEPLSEDRADIVPGEASGAASRDIADTPDRREAILMAALECFAELGFSRTTMGEVRKRSGASTGSLYHHFGSKEALAAAVYVEAVRRYQTGLSMELARSSSAEAGIRGLVRYHLTWVEENPEWARYLMQSRGIQVSPDARTEMSRLNREMFQSFADWVQPFVDAGEVEALPRDLYAATIMGPAQYWVRGRLSGRERTGLETAIAVLGELAWQSLRAREA